MPLLELDLFVVGQVDGDGLAAGVAVTRVVDHIVGVEVGIGAGGFGLVGGVDGETALEVGEEGGVFFESLGPVDVFNEHVSLECGLVAEDAVFVGFDGADDAVDAVVLHLHPLIVAGAVLVVDEREGAGVEVLAEAGVVGELGAFGEFEGGGLQLRAEE